MEKSSLIFLSSQSGWCSAFSARSYFGRKKKPALVLARAARPQRKPRPQQSHRRSSQAHHTTRGRRSNAGQGNLLKACAEPFETTARVAKAACLTALRSASLVPVRKHRSI